MIISLIGYMGCGKTTIGKEISKSTGLKYIDLDEYISFNEQSTIKDIFSKKGELYFRKKENYYLNELLNLEQVILSLGGGTPVYYDNMDIINKKSTSFYLKLSPKQLAERLIKEKHHRPLISHLQEHNIEEFIAKHLFERSSYYEQSTYRINADKPISEISEEIIEKIKN